MKLLKYKVNKFRSVKGTDWIELDQSTCFVGVNESGKTNLLLPLWKFNPADEATKIDLLHDYPREEYSELDDQNKELESEPFIEALFQLDDTEIEECEKAYSKFLESEVDEPEEAPNQSQKKTKKYGFTKLQLRTTLYRKESLPRKKKWSLYLLRVSKV